MDDTLKKVSRWYESAVDNETDAWRSMCRNWHDYYHGEQLEPDVIRQLEERSQPVIVFNLIKAIVGLVAGQEVQRRTDVHFVGVEESDQLKAETLTQIYRQMGEAEYFDNELSESFLEGVIGGRGVMEVFWDEKENSSKREWVPWNEIYLDPASKRKDYEDGRHMYRVRWVDIDVAIEMFPDKEAELKDMMGSDETSEASEDNFNARTGRKQADYGDDMDENKLTYIDPKRERIKLIECWWKDDSAENGIKTAVYTGNSTDRDWLQKPMDSPYKHGQFPYVVFYGARSRKRIPYGLVKNLTSPQDVINKMVSKSMHILGTKQIIAEEGAISNMQNVQENISRADSIISGFANGAIGSGKVIINDNRQDAGLAFQHFETGVVMMNRISGVNPELQGLSTNARSGTAISMRMRQGNTVLADLYDALSRCKKKIAEMTISNMAQYMTGKEVMRYTAPNGATEEVEINSTKEVVDPLTAKVLQQDVNKISDIFKYDVVVSEAPDTANQNEHEFTQLVELLKAVPQSATPEAISQLVLATNLSGKEIIAKSIAQQPQGQPQQ
tara:strand:- start:3701 stop:5371 length:1671 start_codon:yes stop_codon:yes gene_type:complete